MPGDTVVDPPPLPLITAPTAPAVFRLASGQLEPLDNVLCLGIEQSEGADPGRALFRYVFDEPGTGGDPAAPTGPDGVLPLTSEGGDVVKPDDRLVVATTAADGSRVYLFDGFALAPEAVFKATGEATLIQALGVAVREWDSPLDGALWRDAGSPTDGTANVAIGGPARFNPDGLPNATGPNYDVQSVGGTALHPAFIDPTVPFASASYRQAWTLGGAAKYVINRGNPHEDWTKKPENATIENLLQPLVPTSPGGVIDPADPSSYTTQEVTLTDRLLNCEPWPDALDGLLRPFGFGMAFRLRTGSDGLPETYLALYRHADPTAAAKRLYLQPGGQQLDPAKSNVSRAALARDASRIVNAWTIQAAPERYEASFVLAPGFSVSSADTSNRDAFKSSNNSPTADRDKYRLFVFDEAGEGHWDFNAGAWSTTIPSLDAVLGANNYVQRRRPGAGHLLSLDSNGKPIRAELCVLVGWGGNPPAVWDGTGTAYPVRGQWHIERDFLGIRISCEDPNAFHVGPYKDVSALRGGVVPLVEWYNSPSSRVHLMLTTTIEADAILSAAATKREASPTAFAITRKVDAADRYRKDVVKAGSRFNPGPSDKVVRDDTTAATADAEARRASHELGPFAGPVTIPRLTTAYRIGDRIRQISGRGVDLRMNVAAEQSEGAVYPRVVGIEWSFEQGFRTVLKLSDFRGDRA